MDYTKAGIIIAIGLVVVVLINIGLYLVFSRKDHTPGTIELMVRAGKRAKNPWSDEDNALEELSELVKTLREEDKGSVEGENVTDEMTKS